jgi:phytoene dehydrogenase-like protein
MTARGGSYDAVIVGGGHNGLVAATYLARAGRSCLLLERRHELGGAAVSEQVFPGVPARLSSYSYLVSLLPKRIVDELGLGVRLARRRVSSYTPDPRVACARGLLVDGDDPAGTLESFRRVTGSADSLGAWEAFYAMTRRVASAVFPTLLEPLRSRAEMRRLVGDERAWEAIFERPVGEAVAKAFPDDLVAGVALTDALIGTFASADQADLRQNRCFLYHVIGGGTGEWQLPVGGMGAVTGALAEAAMAAGAELRTGSEVLGVEPGSDGAQLRFAEREPDGELGAAQRVSAKMVLVNAAPGVLERLLGREPDAADAPEGSQVKFNMLLTRLPRLRDERTPAELAFAGTFHVNESASQLQLAFERAAGGEIPSPVPCETYCHSLTDPSILTPELRAAGVQTLTVFALHMPARLFRADPERAKAEATAGVMRSLESVLAEPLDDCLLRGPDGEPCIEVRSPLDIERELAMPGGHIFHRDLSWPFTESEEEVGSWGVETEHPAVLLCGAGARRGGGVSGIPGRNAAMAALATHRRA